MVRSVRRNSPPTRRKSPPLATGPRRRSSTTRRGAAALLLHAYRSVLLHQRDRAGVTARVKFNGAAERGVAEHVELRLRRAAEVGVADRHAVRVAGQVDR